MKQILLIGFLILMADAATAQDERLVGQWILKKAENIDGSPKIIDDKMRGAKYVISSNGSLYIDFPFLNKLPGFLPPKSSWTTSDSKLTTINQLGRSSTSDYEIKNDTMILKTKTEKTYWVKARKKRSK